MKRRIFMGAMFALIGFFALSTMVMAGTYVGKYCFKYDSYPDTWIWYVDAVGDAYQVTGSNTVYTPPSSLNGGGAVSGGFLYITMDERGINNGVSFIGQHTLYLDLSTMTGRTWVGFFDINGNLVISYPAGLTFHPVICGKTGAPGYQESDGPRTADVR